ncbi:MAG: DNA mismatch endonuclease Vsr [Chitinophagaceae bacterium]|nr:DNA mismatch endonuclease Vsr [Chitinophagaceae bacterium]
MDTVDQQTRSNIMSRVKSKNTSPELKFRKGLFARGFRYLLHGKLPGKPDLVFPQYKSVIFVNGCFWHGHDCPRFRIPSSNVDYWKAKFERNMANDKRNHEALRSLGWRVLVVWECTLTTKKISASIDQAEEWLVSADIHL